VATASASPVTPVATDPTGSSIDSASAQQELSQRSIKVAPTASSAEQARALPPLTDEQEQQLDRLGELEGRLEDQR
jgi:ABC-type phosphate/phosphonate transport system substrate-binding protein